MTKRIVSGVFLLIALGALGLILAGALTSGEQLIVRFLTAIVVAALCLYVISDLRLEADEKSASKSSARTSAAEGARRRAAQSAPLPPNSTAAFMATVTGKRSATTAAANDVDPDEFDRDRTASDEADGDTDREGAVEVDAAELGLTEEDMGGDEREAEWPAPVLDAPPASTETPAGYPEEPVEAAAWPQTPDGRAVADDEQPSDGLVAIFSKQNKRDESELDQELEVVDHPLVVNGFHRPLPKPIVTGPTLTSIDGGAGVLLPAGNATGSSARDRENENSPTHDEAASADELVAMADPHTNPEPVTVSVDSGGDPLLGELHLNPEPAAATGSTRAWSTSEDTPGAVILSVSAPQPMPASAIGKDPSPEVEAAAYARARVLSLLAGETGSADIDAAIRSGELEIISSLVADETLSSEGPISDSDVRTMVFVAFTSNELRKILLSGGRLDVELDDIELEDLDLGPVEVFPTAAAARSVAAAALPTPGSTLAATCVDGVAKETSTEREQAVAAS